MAGTRRLERAVAGLPRYAGTILVGVAALSVLALLVLVDLETGRVRLGVDASLERLLPDEAPARRFYEETRRRFGNDEALLVVLGADDVFRADVLERIDRATRRIEALPEVDRVLSLTAVPLLRARDGDLVVEPAVEAIPDDPAALAALRAEVLGNPLLAGSLVARDGRATALVVVFHEISDRAYLETGVDDRVVALAREEADPDAGVEVFVTGGPHLYVESARVLLSDLGRLPLLIGAGMAAVLLLAFRTLRGVLVPMATLAVALLWTLAAISALGRQLNVITVLVPPLLITLGLSYAMHVVSEWGDVLRERGGGDARSLVGAAMERVALPVVLTGVTTAAGLGALLLSPLAAVREFGALSCIGVVCTVLASLTLTPSLLALLPTPRRARRADGRLLDRLTGALGAFDVRHRRAIFAAAAAVAVVSAIGVGRIEVGTQQITKFRPSASARVDFEAVNARLDGANPLLVVLTTTEPEGFLEPTNLRQVESLQRWLEAQPEVGGTSSIVDALAIVHRALRDGAEVPAIPETRSRVSQLLFFGAGDELARFVDAPFETALVEVRANVLDSADVAALAARIERRLGELPRGLEGRMTGPSLVFNQALDEIIRGQTWSVVAALGVVYLILSALFVSLRVGLLALIPNALPMGAYFGALGLGGVMLSPATSLIAPMVLGIAVDDTIHYLARFIREARRLADEERATAAALRAVGRPVTYTTAALCVGFLMLNGSGFTTQGQLGNLAAFALAFAWVCDVTFTPALSAGLRITSLWDLIAVDLGEDPTHRIRLFHGLSAARARVVALLGQLVAVRAGERLWFAGEPGGALYVVIDGRLRATVPHEDGTRELLVHGRGDLVGEVGFFHDRRSADLEVVEDARLLRITRSEYDQLTGRYPRIASVVARNLSEVLAERLAGTTDLLQPPRSAPAHGDELRRRGRDLDHAFFRAEADVYRRELLARAEGRGDARATAGRVDGGLVERLAGLGIGADTLAALLLIPLVEVAWADGRLDEGEREAVLAGAAAAGLAADHPSQGLLRVWLEAPPDGALHEAWHAFMEAVSGELSVESRVRLRDAVVGHARAVGESAGGFLGFRAVSRAEEDVLARLERAFRL